MNIFEKAVKGKYRFPFKGSITVEDLFDLSVTDLDTVFKSLNSQVKQVKEESLLSTRTKTKSEDVLETSIEIVKYIVTEKLTAAEKAQADKVKSVELQKLYAILEEKKNIELADKSPEEIQSMINALLGK